MEKTYTVMAVKLHKRHVRAEEFQRILTKYGGIIRMRLGLHEAGDISAENGLILLQLVPGAEEIPELEKELRDMEGVEFKSIEV